MFRTLDVFDTEYSADSVEWCPAEDFQNIFACGTYQLTEKDEKDNPGPEDDKKKRIGRIYLFQVTKIDEEPKLSKLQQIEVAAVLDMKWAHVRCLGDRILLGVVNAAGFLQIYELTKSSTEAPSLSLVSEVSIGEDDGEDRLALSLDWSTGRRFDLEDQDVEITVSDSGGSISVLKLGDGGKSLERVHFWKAHEFEAWITAFDYWDTNVVYSGGDDCKFLRFDTRTGPKPTMTCRVHEAGVTSLHSNWEREYSLVSGSYDEIVRTWDTRQLRRPLGELSLGGGVWRLKWDPREARLLLAAGMYNGFFVVDCDIEQSPKLVAEYKEHKSIAYGCDWSFAKRDDKELLLATCSFYDHALKLSSVELSDDA
ncbi:diphthine methyltransferase [Nasonia vitripennis]|uniref:methylated diphthine methylhydrolase n=1 Tax=Nasonia vitripennis TaxID=7425 RepID=A0A7M7PYC9_NASVI|nr:diphthine methyltransferase [Nasonia vitripennis]XP_031778014.1 diphthine methyltransferase [Nasonia vitripennis]XP_031778015.1 diphthine methyltransferase [Nasonia vitripennis]